MLTGLNHITLAVSNLDTSLQFYTQYLNFKGHVAWDKGAYLSLGDLWLCLSLDEPDAKTDYTHIAFDISESEFSNFVDELKKQGVQSWKDNRSEGASFYLLDPDGHKLELHVGDLQSRLKSLQQQPYPGLRWL